MIGEILTALKWIEAVVSWAPDVAVRLSARTNAAAAAFVARRANAPDFDIEIG